MPNLTFSDYHIGWISALHKEMTAALAMLDDEHDRPLQQTPEDHNSYAFGRVHQHNGVIACMPDGVNGSVSAANVARDMARTFPSLRIGLMVGIGGGLPNLSKGVGVRLGDIVVSKPEKSWGGVVQYDMGRAEGDGSFVITGQLNQPPALLLRTVTQIRARHSIGPSKISHYIDDAVIRNPMLRQNNFVRPDEVDCLHCKVCDHDIESYVADCCELHAKRKPRTDNQPMIHYGIIASANQVMENATLRDRLRDQFDALCVEMEAAGLMNDFPCLVIRGICDYADLHKNDAWQPYAAIAAAAYAKELLEHIPPTQGAQKQTVQPSSDTAAPKHTHTPPKHGYGTKRLGENSECHDSFIVTPYRIQKELLPDRSPGTCQWLLAHPMFCQWTSETGNRLLWISAEAGFGKSVFAKSLIDNELRNTNSHTVCYFFFKADGEQNSLSKALCCILHQLFTRQPCSIGHAEDEWNEEDRHSLIRNPQKLWRIFLAAISDSQARDVTCLLDSVDECDVTDQSLLVELITNDCIQKSIPGSEGYRPSIEFILLSRPCEGIKSTLQSAVHDLSGIHLKAEEAHDQINADIDIVARMRIGRLATALKLNQQTQVQWMDRLLKFRQRTQLWLFLAISTIHDAHDSYLRSDQAVIDSVPSTVEDAYQQTLHRVPVAQESNVRKILQIIVGARRPLTIEEIAIALGIATSTPSISLEKGQFDPSSIEKGIRQYCGPITIIKYGRIGLLHRTAKEFLVGHWADAATSTGWKYCLSPGEIEKHMGRICIAFLWSQEIKMKLEMMRADNIEPWEVANHLDEEEPIDSFLLYAVKYWPEHFEAAQTLVNDAFLPDIDQLYDTHNDLYRLWYPIFRQIDPEYDVRPGKQISLVACLGHDEVLKTMLATIDQCNINEDDYRTPLGWALTFGHEKTAKILLQKGADPNVPDTIHGNWLLYTSEHGDAGLVRLLLEHGAADVNVFEEPENSQVGQAFRLASRYGHEQVVRILLESCTETLYGFDYALALTGALDEGGKTVAALITEACLDVNNRNSRGLPFNAASRLGFDQVVRALLENGAEVDMEDEEGTALQGAAQLRGDFMVRILLDHGAKIDLEGPNGTALQIAKFHGREKIVQTLLAYGAKTDNVPHRVTARKLPSKSTYRIMITRYWQPHEEK